MHGVNFIIRRQAAILLLRMSTYYTHMNTTEIIFVTSVDMQCYSVDVYNENLHVLLESVRGQFEMCLSDINNFIKYSNKKIIQHYHVP
jgi:hypothetical protein